MGDLIGEALEGESLIYIPPKQLETLSHGAIANTKIVELIAECNRINIIYMIALAGSGHIGSSFSSIDLVTWLMINEVYPNLKQNKERKNIFFSSKGHDAPAFYASLIGLGIYDSQLLNSLRRLDGLPGHPDIHTPEIITNTGSLGMGISKAQGLAIANRLSGIHQNIFVLLGDGELQEGQIWESLHYFKNHNLKEVIPIVDHNKIQSDTFLEDVSSLGDLEAKFSAFGLNVVRMNGHDIASFENVFYQIRDEDQPTIVIADTIKGKGVSFMENDAFDSNVDTYKFHSGAPSKQVYDNAVKEIWERIEKLCGELGVTIETEKTKPTQVLIKSQNQSFNLIDSYADLIVKAADKNDKIIALDADLVLDTGLIPFKNKYPDRFIECGIAEQDMVSKAGGLALFGFHPFVHSFSCFLCSRPAEQMFNNATEGRPITYVGSLSGLIPAGPGHSHQSLRDIALMSSIPGMTVFQPFNPTDLSAGIDYALKDKSGFYIRLTSGDQEKLIDSELISDRGKGYYLKKEGSAAVLAYGPTMLNNIIRVNSEMGSEADFSIINMPWINVFDEEWLTSILSRHRSILVIEDHFEFGGLGTNLLNFIATSRIKNESLITIKGINEIPGCGQTDEVLKNHGLDTISLEALIKRLLDTGKVC